MGGEGPPPAELMEPEGHEREREAEKAVPAIPEQASASRKRPEEEEEEHSVQWNKSGPRCWFCACAAEVPGFGTHADYGGGGAR